MPLDSEMQQRVLLLLLPIFIAITTGRKKRGSLAPKIKLWPFDPENVPERAVIHVAYMHMHVRGEFIHPKKRPSKTLCEYAYY